MAETEIEATVVVDARGLLCPMPIVKTAKAMKGLADGDVLKVISTDRGSIADIPAWAETTGNELLEWHEEGETFVFLLRRGKEE
jgi:TusA-related sulfurtransferase